nr:hypothetical protein [Faecalibacterium prausnitzii]
MVVVPYIKNMDDDSCRFKALERNDKKVCSDFCFFGDTLLAKKEFRNLLQYRLHYAKSYVADFFTRIFFPPMETLMIRPDMQAGGCIFNMDLPQLLRLNELVKILG